MWWLKLFTSSPTEEERRRRPAVVDPVKEQAKASKQIDKQLKKDRRRFRLTYRMQLVGMEGAGKSVIIKQMELMTRETFPYSLRVEIRDEIRHSIKHAALNRLLKRFNESEFDRQENRQKKRWLIKNLENSSLDSDDDQMLIYYLKSVWSDPGVQRFIQRNQHDQELQSASYFIQDLEIVLSPTFVPRDLDILLHYHPTQNVMETSFRLEEITFNLFEIKGYKWAQMESADSLATIFVVDISTFDVVVDHRTGMTHLRTAMMNFKTFWNSQHVQNRSVILLLNKTDLFEDKISGGIKLERFFPELDNYRRETCQLLSSSEARPHRKGRRKFTAKDEVTVCKLFIRDCFLQLANYNQDVYHHCYVHFLCAINTDEVVRVLKACCRDILQRENLKMHEIL